MAKGKHAAALFEVIHSDKKYDRAKTGAMLQTPKWWSSNTASPVSAPTKTVRVAADHAPAPLDVAAPSDAPHVDPMKPTADRLRTTMNLDPDQQQIAFKLSYTTAIVAAFAVLVVVGMSYIIGKSLHGGPQQAVASPPTTVVQSGSILEGVLDVGPTNTKPVSGVIPVAPANGATGNKAATPAPSNTPTKPPADTAPPARVIDDAKRIVGLNYVIVQSYPVKAQAEEARDALLKSGIAVTVEGTPPSFGRRDWFSVIGTKGFDRIKSREFETYVTQIEAVNMKFASDRSFKAFKPQAFKWK